MGSLMWYSARTRYDISHSVSRLAQHLEAPTRGTMAAARRVMLYMATTADMKLTADITLGENVWDLFVDSDHAGDRKSPTGAKSHTGVISLLNGMPYMWKSNKQPDTSISSAAAEIYALGDAVKYANSTGYRAEELGLKMVWPRQVHVDNSAAVSFQGSTNPCTRLEGTFDLRDKWVTEVRDRKKVEAVKVKTKYNMADLLTKCQNATIFTQLVTQIQGRHKDLSRRQEWYEKQKDLTIRGVR